MRIKAVPVTKENFKDMGQVIQLPDIENQPSQHSGEGFVHHAELAFIDTKGPVEFGITTFEKRPPIATQLEQHAKTPELLLALTGPFIMPVAPKKVENGKEVPDMDKLRGIRVKQGEGIIFDDGQFHWAPFPVEGRAAVLVGFVPKTWADDIVIIDLDEPVELEL